MKYIITILFVCFTYMVIAQTYTDSIKQVDLNEIVITNPKKISRKVIKPLGSLDEYLQQSNSVTMIRRGGYASEPFINSMSTDRSVITIDGMRIYAACTDKMDPVTSYVEISNLEKAEVNSGTLHASTGATIAGSLNLVRKKSNFAPKQFNGSAFAGFESNNKQRVFGSNVSYTTPKYYVDIDATYRKSDNYKAGGATEIIYSQFQKVNSSAIFGYKISQHKQLEASVIYDHATNVGYAALPMDVLFAKALITALEYQHHHITEIFSNWKTKVYYNTVTHVMDDSKRPDVPIRMDMPGWSKTSGFFSELTGKYSRNEFKMALSGHHNYSLAEMTMFSNIATQKDMFMLTWPGVTTNYLDFFASNHYQISDQFSIQANAGLASHTNQLKNEFGFTSLQIFYPDLQKSKTRVLKRVATTLQFNTSKFWQYNLTIGYGERAPSVSEGYGFYLFNSFDRFDYIGNPNLKNEKSTSILASVNYNATNLQIKFTGSVFYLNDYIIGVPDSSFSTMTIGAAGVKVYKQLRGATIYNSALNFNYKISNQFSIKNKLVYSRGFAVGNVNLPTIQPFGYQSELMFANKNYAVTAGVKGALKQNNINPTFGEQPLPGYTICNTVLSKDFYLSDTHFIVKIGAENILDTKYTTFADWNRLPQMGRNFFINTIINF